jgi:hypothetical protein
MCWFSGPKMRPEVLNTRSQLAEVAGIPRYCLAIRERFGSSASCLGHHLRMSSSMWASGNFKYISTWTSYCLSSGSCQRPTIGVRWSDISIWRRSGFSAVVKCICIVLFAGTTATYEAQNLDYRLLQPQMILIRWGDRVCSLNQIKSQIFYCNPTSKLLHDKLLY